MSATTTPAGAAGRGQFGDSPARVATAVTALVGLLLMLASVGLATIEGSWTWWMGTPFILLGVGALAVGFFVVFNFEWLGDVITGRAALSGILVAVMCVAAVVVWAVGIYFFAYRGQITIRKTTIRLTKSWDLTGTKRFTLTGPTRGQLAELQEPLRIMVVGRLFNPYSERPDAQAEDLLAMYRAASPLVTLEYILTSDPERGVKLKALADKMHRSDPNELKFGTVVLLYKDQFKSFQSVELWETRPWARGQEVMEGQIFKGEEVFTSAIYQMLDSKKPKVYFVWGHGERDPEARDYRGMSFARDKLQADNMETAKLMLATAEKVPDDADLLVICGPRQPFGPRELETLKAYVDARKGRLLICLDEYRPEADLGLDGFLAQFGIAVGHDKVIEPDRGHLIPEEAQVALAWDYGYHPVVERLREGDLAVLFGPARTVRRLDEYRGDWNVDVLVSGSEASYGETDLDTLYNKGQKRYEEGKDTPKPASYAVASWAGRAPMPGGRMDKELGRVVVVGDSNWCSNQIFRMFGNKSFFTATVKWMLGQEKRIAIEPKKAEGEGLTLLPAQRKMTRFAVLTLCVLLLLVAGLTAWIRRR